MQRYFDQFKSCREHDIPACAHACPFNLDILDLKSKIEKNRYSASYRNIRNAVIFPEIVATLCPGYCENACVRKDIDSPVQIRLLEKTVMAATKKKEPNSYNLPAKSGRIAVIGAGISGMSFALRLASKKYDVTVFEKSGKPGGHLNRLLDEDIYLKEFDLQFKNEKYTLNLDTEVTDIKALSEQGYDIIYVATGKDGCDFGLLDESSDSYVKSGGPCTIIGNTAVFAGGSLCGKDTMHALAHGSSISNAAEIYLKIQKLEYPQPQPPTGAMANENKLFHMAPILPADGKDFFTDEEAAAEAGRCISCQCDKCQSYCDIVGFFKKWPIKMRDEILLTCKPSKSLVHKNPAMRYINTCTQCDIFSQACPEDIDLCHMIKEARRKIHTLDKTPGGFRQYWLRDMAFANGDYAAVKRQAPQAETCRYAFFPGCNLGALNPDYVIKPYKWLLSIRPDTGLLLRCCSVPVDWNGERDAHEEEIKKLAEDWEALGRPKLITACMSCAKHLKEYLPEIELISLYEVLHKWGFLPEEIGSGSSLCPDRVYSIFDPCSARNEKSVQAAVRALSSKVNIKTEELPSGDLHGCCGFGGMGSVATPDFARYVADERSGLSDNPYIVYCSNCRDVFADNDKPVIHILDALFDVDPCGSMKQPTVTQRRINRVILKERLLEEIWEEEMEMKPEGNKYKLKMTEEIRNKINEQKLLEEDICQVIENSIRTGRRTFEPESDYYKAYLEIGAITVWVEYSVLPGAQTSAACNTPDSPDFDTYEIHNVYSHRMHIELEAVFNGRKIDEQ